MPFDIVGTNFYLQYRCKCGAEGEMETEGDELLGNSFTVFSIPCPNCGRELSIDEDEDDDEDYDEDFD